MAVPKQKIGSSYKKQFDDYMEKYQKYYKDWNRKWGGQNRMGMGSMPGMGMGMGMPMGGYGMNGNGNANHTRTHPSQHCRRTCYEWRHVRLSERECSND